MTCSMVFRGATRALRRAAKMPLYSPVAAG
jgi:hypothetical protein